VSRARTLIWFAQHESRLAWRDWLARATAGGRRKLTTGVVGLILLAALMHLVAYSIVERFSDIRLDTDKVSLVVITGSLLGIWLLMLSHAMEMVTHAFYARSDHDLILTSPAAAQKVFALRIITVALSIVLMGALLASPIINALAVRGGPQWLGTYAVVASFGFAAAAVAIALTIGLFKSIGPQRTRVVAQILAAVVGAAFMVSLQVAAIIYYGTFSRIDILRSESLVALAPDFASILYWPARAMQSDPIALAGVLSIGVSLLAAAAIMFSPRFGDHVISAAGVARTSVRQRLSSTRFRTVSPKRALRNKEWMLLLRDPWLMSQTLMQILYLLPPWLLLWRSLKHGGALLVLVPVLTMAAGQLAGGLSWLAISGEDAPDLVASAPVSSQTILSAKIEAVMGGVAIVFAPLVAVLAFLVPLQALVATLGIIVAAASATRIQLWFRSRAKRGHFQHRLISSRTATFAETLSSIAWAASAALVASSGWHAVTAALLAITILIGARLISPRGAS
jgi:ABC-2 type transport system permease protein